MLKASFYNLCLILFFLGSCSQTEEVKKSELTYFDIKGFFLNEASKLNSKETSVLKKVEKNGESEEKLILIKDWEKELNLFIESDINKPSWINSYNIEIKGDTMIYNANTPDLRARVIKIIDNDSQPKSLIIKNESSNKLYKSYETLYYYPDSIYIIEKEQQVRFLGENSYRISGIFIH